MRKWIVVLLVLLLSVTTAYARPAAKKAQASKKPAKAKVVEQQDPYKAFVVVESSTGMVVEGENVHAKRAPASVTKLMVALVVLEKLAKGEIKLTDQVTTSREASKIGGSQVYLKEGESFSLEDMMKAMLVASGNDAAYAIAEFAGGSKEEFVRLMNERAKALGMADSEFHSVHGLPPSRGDAEDVTSCNDLAILARELLKYPKLLEWTSIKSEGFRDGKFMLQNHNKLLIRMPGVVDGMKTGYYRETGFNVVATGKRGELRFIVVVMGSPSAKVRDGVAAEKFKKAFASFKMLNVVKKGELIEKEIILDDGKYRKIKGVAKTGFAYPMASDKKGAVKKEIAVPERIKGEIAEGQKLGEVVIRLDADTIGKVDIVSPVFVPKANLFTRMLRRLGLNL